jgi:aspartate/methionine/tyrosine aminotransferase
MADTTTDPAADPNAAALARLREVHDDPELIDLSVGEPDMATPAAITEAGIEALRGGATHYTPRVGYASLREIIAAKLERENGYTAAVDDIVVTGGGSPAIAIAIGAACTAGDTILVPDPGWPNYEIGAGRFGVRTRRYQQDPEAGVAFDLEQIESLIDETTRMVVITSPSNPTGGTASPEEVRGLVELCERRGLLICADEAYEAIVFEGTATSPAAVGGADFSFGCFTLSKTYAMTGWRLGYVTAPPRFRDLTLAMQIAISGCASAMCQRAGETALSDSHPEVEAAVETYRRRRDRAAEIAEPAGLLKSRPGGAFYLWLDISASGLTGQEMTDHLVRDHQVLVSAGEVYSQFQPGHIRVSFATDEQLLVEGMTRIASAVAELRG